MLVTRVHGLDAAPVGPDGLGQRQLDEMRRAALLRVEHRAPVELEPAVVVVDGGADQRIAGRRDRELLVAPVLGEPAGERCVVGLRDERQRPRGG